jgi:hypothetical protein
VADADDRMLISRRILDAAYRLDGLRLADATPPIHVAAPAAHAAPLPPAPVAPEPPIVPIASLLYDTPPAAGAAELPIVSIESLGYDRADEVVAIESLAPEGGLEASFRSYDRLRRERGPVPARAEETVTVEIGVLCYTGRAALERAVAVRQQLAAELSRDGGLDSIKPLLQELLDLVPLALAES